MTDNRLLSGRKTNPEAREMTEKLKILVVDDNEEFARNMKDVLELRGYEVLTATDGVKALDIVKEDGLHLVMMDIKMPIMNGVETFKKMRQIAPDTPVIMMTAFAVEELIRESLQNGAFGVIRKPVNFDKLFCLIENTLGKGMMILTVDDDENICKNIKDVLCQKGYRVAVALDGNSAIEKAKETNFDVMLLDMKLPPLNGLETYLVIHDLRPGLIVIIITDHTLDMKDMIDDVIRNGAYTCLEKPIDMNGLIKILDELKRMFER